MQRTLFSGDTRPPLWRIVIAFFGIYVIWGSAYIAIHFTIQTIPPFIGASGRFLVAGGLLYLWIRRQGVPNPTRRQWLSASVAGFLMFLINNGLLVWSQQIVPSGMSSLIIGCSPIFIVLLDWLRPGGHRPPLQVFAGLALGAFGLALLVDPSHMLVSGPQVWIGVGALIIAALGWAIGTIYNQHADLPPSTMMSTATQLFTGGVMLGILSLVTGETAHFDPASVSLTSFVALTYLALASSLFGYGSYVWLLRVIRPSIVSTYSYVSPIVALFLGWLLANEPLSWRTLIAAVIILGSVMVINSARFSAPVGKLEEAPTPEMMPEVP